MWSNDIESAFSDPLKKSQCLPDFMSMLYIDLLCWSKGRTLAAVQYAVPV